jgi:hypothetical protein
MKTKKALKRLTHSEDLISDVIERYSADAPEMRQQLLDAKAAVGRVKDAVSLKASSETSNDPKMAATTKAPVKVPPVRAAKKQRTTKRDYEG